MRGWVYSPHTGGTKIPPRVQEIVRHRILAYAAKHHAGKFIRIDVRFHGALCYIDAYQEPELLPPDKPAHGETREEWIERQRNLPHHLCRIRYKGDIERWTIAYYTYAHEKYEPSFFQSGEDYGTPEEAFETSAQFL